MKTTVKELYESMQALSELADNKQIGAGTAFQIGLALKATMEVIDESEKKRKAILAKYPVETGGPSENEEDRDKENLKAREEEWTDVVTQEVEVAIPQIKVSSLKGRGGEAEISGWVFARLSHIIVEG